MIVRDDGFHQEDFAGPFVTLDDWPANDCGGAALDLDPGADAAALTDRLTEIAIIRIAFPSFADGRGFTLAAILRRMGYAGRLRAAGHVIADQYAMARRAGFDEVEIDAALAARQPEAHWLARADWRSGDYQTRLRGAR